MMRSIALLKEMVDIDSQTAQVEGVGLVQAIVARELSSMGFTIKHIDNPNPDIRSGQLLLATLKGEKSEFITFVSHVDTVMGVDSVGSFRTDAAKEKAFGSGVIDNKGGLVVALEGLRKYLAALKSKGERPAYSIRFVSSPNEEGGSTGFHDVFRKCAEDSVAALGFEPALEDGSIVESRRGNRWYLLKIAGQEAHAGRCKGEQINAAHDFAIKISKLQKLNNLRKGISVNVGHVEGGRGRFNVVCGNITAMIDARFANFKSRDRLHEKIKKILLSPAVKSTVTGKKSLSTFTIEDDCPPFASTLRSRSILKYYLNVVKEIEGREIKALKAGGAGDVNYMSAQNVMVLDGLGPVGGGMHTTGEFIVLSSLVTRSETLAKFLSQISKKL
jgi:glutamate carboxypeptidase